MHIYKCTQVVTISELRGIGILSHGKNLQIAAGSGVPEQVPEQVSEQVPEEVPEQVVEEVAMHVWNKFRSAGTASQEFCRYVDLLSC